MNRGRKLLLAQRAFGHEPLGPPPDWLEPAEVAVWHEIVAATPVKLLLMNEPPLALAASCVEQWRAGRREPGFLTLCYRMLGDFFIPMHERRRLLFPERQRP